MTLCSLRARVTTVVSLNLFRIVFFRTTFVLEWIIQAHHEKTKFREKLVLCVDVVAWLFDHEDGVSVQNRPSEANQEPLVDVQALVDLLVQRQVVQLDFLQSLVHRRIRELAERVEVRAQTLREQLRVLTREVIFFIPRVFL